jgi:hypothetical protein
MLLALGGTLTLGENGEGNLKNKLISDPKINTEKIKLIKKPLTLCKKVKSGNPY